MLYAHVLSELGHLKTTTLQIGKDISSSPLFLHKCFTQMSLPKDAFPSNVFWSFYFIIYLTDVHTGWYVLHTESSILGAQALHLLGSKAWINAAQTKSYEYAI